MLAVRITEHGGPEVLRPVDIPVPEPVDDEVLVRNEWIGVNYVDLQHRAGSPYPVSLPLIPGTEAAGIVEAVGPAGDPTLVGRPVVHFGHMAGVYAEWTAAPATHVVALEDDTPLDVAAGIALAGTTAHVLVREAADVTGRSVVVHAAAGATGAAVLQLARAAGATVIAVTSTRTKARTAVELGAHHAIALDTHDDPVAAVRHLTGGHGADLVFDATGRDTFEISMRMLRTRGRLVVYGAASGEPAPLPVSRLSGITADADLAGSLTVSWISSGHFLVGEARARAARAVLTDVREGRLVPRIAGRLPLREAAAAHAQLASRSTNGKLLLKAGVPP